MRKAHTLEKKSGIYKIENILNGDFYIGSSMNVYKRYYQHRTLLKNNRHYSVYLQNAWNKYGHENFVFSILAYAELDIVRLRELEQLYLDAMCPSYNMSKKVFNLSMSPRSESHRSNISKSLKNSKLFQSREFKEKISNSVRSLWADDEYRDNQIKAMNSESAKENYSNSMKRRWQDSEYKSEVLNSVLNSFSSGKNKTSKFDKDDILTIRRLASNGVDVKEICDTYDSSYKTIRRIVTRQTWNFV